MSSERFTIDGDSGLEKAIRNICDEVRYELSNLIPKKKLQGIVLGGGYGRGEGGVLKTKSGDAPYNDVEYFVFVKGGHRKYQEQIHYIEERLTLKHGVDVEFKLLPLKKLRSSKPTMFFYDLLAGHRWVLGNDSLFEGCDHHLDASAIPLKEATRLLMNRSAGLLFARERLMSPEFTRADADFVARNIAKAQLALGDAALTVHGQYHWSCRTRHKCYRELYSDKTLTTHHQFGVEFKLHPCQTNLSRNELLDLHTEVSQAIQKVFLEVESKRLGRFFPQALSYLRSPVLKCFEQNTLRNRLINFRDNGLAGILEPRHPRERLLSLLCRYLWCQHGSRPLPGTDFKEITRLWQQYG